MKKAIKICAALAVSASLALSLAAFAGCGDGDEADITLISGDFTNEATSEQLSELSDKISSSNSATLYGDSSENGWGYNVRMVEFGEIYIGVSASYGGESFTMNMDTDMDFDHTISFSNDGDGINVWGSGTIDYTIDYTIDTDMVISGQAASGTIGYSGNCYNDADYMYIDGTVYATSGTESLSESGKFKMSLGEVLDEGIDIDTEDIAEALIGLDEIRSAMNAEGVTIYVDESSDDTLKIKISYSKDAWFNMFYEELQAEMAAMGASLTYEELYDNTTFRYMDYYLEFDNDTGILVGAGSKLDATMNMSLTVEGMAISYSFDFDVDCWYMSTDTPASALPDDLDEYMSV